MSTFGTANMGTIKRKQNQIYLSFVEREYLRVANIGTIKQVKSQIYVV